MSNEPDEVNSGALATALVLVAFATLAVALVVTALVRDTTKEMLAEKDVTQENAVRHMKSEQIGELTGAPAWTDKAAGLVHVPIDRAMEMVLSDLRANPYALSPGYKPKEKECECPKKEAVEGEATSDEAQKPSEEEKCECPEEEKTEEAAPEAAPEEASTPEATAEKSEEKAAPAAAPAPAPAVAPAPAPAVAPKPTAPAPAPAE